MVRVSRVRVVWRRPAPGECDRRTAVVGSCVRRRSAAAGELSAGPWALGRVSARRDHRRCLYPAAREHSGPVGGSAALVGPRPPPGGWVRGCRRTVRRAVCPPGGAIDVVYTPRPGNTGRGNGTALGAGSRVGVVGRVPSSLRVVRGGRLGPVGRVLLPFFVRPVGGAAGIRAGRAGSQGLLGLCAGSSSLSLPARSARGPGRVGCGVSGRLVRRRCRSGRCAGGTQGRGRTAQWWPPPPAGSVSRP